MTARSRAVRKRAAFTLIELMIVIVIIALLIGILVPTVAGAIRSAREATVKTEVTALSSAIADFKAQFGINPPSYIDFRLRTGGTGVLNPSTGSLPPATVAVLRRLWPNFNVAAYEDFLRQSVNHPKQRDLDGSSCLVFFLGGMIPSVGAPPVGFSSNPRSPLTEGGKRVGPFIEFKPERLYDANPPADPDDFDGYEGYLDPLPGQAIPYWYVAADRYSAQEALNAAATTAPKDMRPVYRQKGGSYFNAGGFQIISPGPDGATGENASLPGGAYGIGGLFDVTAGTLVDGLPTGHAEKGKAKGDVDNITNFHQGKLLQ